MLCLVLYEQADCHRRAVKTLYQQSRRTDNSLDQRHLLHVSKVKVRHESKAPPPPPAGHTRGVRTKALRRHWLQTHAHQFPVSEHRSWVSISRRPIHPRCYNNVKPQIKTLRVLLCSCQGWLMKTVRYWIYFSLLFISPLSSPSLPSSLLISPLPP